MTPASLHSFIKGESRFPTTVEAAALLKESPQLIIYSLLLFSALFIVTIVFNGFFSGFFESNFGFFLRKPRTEELAAGGLYPLFWDISHALYITVSRAANNLIAVMAGIAAGAPILWRFAELVEESFSGRKSETDDDFFDPDRLKEIYTLTAKSIGFAALGVTGAFLAGCIPFFGPLLSVLLYGVVIAFSLAYLPLGRRNYSAGETLHWLFQNWQVVPVFAIIPTTALFVPLLAVVLVPLCFPVAILHTTIIFDILEVRSGIVAKK